MKTKYILFTIILSFVLGLKGWGQLSIKSRLDNTETSPYSVVYGNKLSDDLIMTALKNGTVTITYSDNSQETYNISINDILTTNIPIKLGGDYSVTGKNNNGGSIGSFVFQVSLSPRMIKVNPIAPGFTVEKEYDGTTDGVCDADEITKDDKIYKKVNFSYCDASGNIDETKPAIVGDDEVYIEIKSVKYKNKDVEFNTDGTISSEKEVVVEYGDLLVKSTDANNYYGCLDVNKKVTYKVGKITQKKNISYIG